MKYGTTQTHQSARPLLKSGAFLCKQARLYLYQRMTTAEPIPNNDSLSKTIHILAPAQQVWAALTIPALMKQWMSDDEIHIHTTWEKNSPLYIHGNLHGLKYENKGTIIACEPAHQLVYTFWSSLSQVADIPENYSIIQFALQEAKNTTTLTLTQTHFLTAVIYHHFNFYWNVAIALIKKQSEGNC